MRIPTLSRLIATIVKGRRTPRRPNTGKAGYFRESRASRHQGLDLLALRKRRARNKVAARSRRINRKAARR